MVNDNMLDIIMVEDSPHDIEFALEGLKEHHLANRVKVLHDGEEAVRYIFRKGKYSDCGICEHPSLILLDLNLPKIDGLEILRRIREDEQTKDIPVVVLTSSEMDNDRIESYRLGVNSYIVKPINAENFIETIAHIGFYWAVLNKRPS
jgi:two-component system, response regulator